MRLFSRKKPIIDETPKTEEKKMTVEDALLEISKSIANNEPDRDVVLQNLFPRSYKDMVVKDKAGVAMDSDIYAPATYTDDLPENMLRFFTHTFIGWQACALLAENPYIRKACEIPARDAIAVDYDLNYENKDADKNPETDKEQEQEVLNYLKRKSDKEMRIKDICRDANIYKKTYGQIIAIPTFNKDYDMSKPFDIKTIKKGSYTGMTLIQPFWVTYELNLPNVKNPEARDFYEPVYYIINGNKKIHKSWIIKLTNGVMPDILKPVYYYGGLPLTQQIYERVFCAEKTANEAPQLALSKRLLVIDGTVNNIVAGSGEAYNVLKALLAVRDNFGLMVKNPNDQVQQIDTALADMDSLIMTQFQLVAAIAEMPVTKLMKTQLKGLANSGNYEMEDYNQTLVEIQENDFTRILDRHYQLLSVSEYGKDLGLEVTWQPIDNPTELEMAQIESAQAQADSAYVAAGIIDATEIRDVLRANKDSRFHNLAEQKPFEENDLDSLNEENEEELESLLK